MDGGSIRPDVAEEGNAHCQGLRLASIVGNRVPTYNALTYCTKYLYKPFLSCLMHNRLYLNYLLKILECFVYLMIKYYIFR